MSDTDVPKNGESESAEPAEIANKSVLKAVRLLRELANQPKTGAAVTSLAKAVGISRPTAFRLLYSLQRSGLVDRIDNNYVLGWEMARLGRHADPYAGLVLRAQPLLQELADKANETVTISVPNRSDGLDLIAEAHGSHVVGIMSRMYHHMVGEQYPLHASSTGKVLLAEWSVEKVTALLPEKLDAYSANTITDRNVLLKELDQVREQGFALTDNELEEELLALSRPIRDPSGHLVAILTLNGPRYRFGRNRIPEGLQQMQQIIDRLADVFWRDSAN